MQFTINKKSFAEAMRLASPIASATGNYLAGVTVAARGGHVHIKASDSEVTLCRWLPADVAEAGEAIADMKGLKKALARAKKGESVTVSLETPERAKQPNLIVQDGTARRVVQGGTACADVRIIEEAGALLTVSAGDVREILDRTSFAISREATRYYLNSVFFEPRPEGHLRVVTVDGHRLAILDTEIPADREGWPLAKVYGKPNDYRFGTMFRRQGADVLHRLVRAAPADEAVTMGISEQGMTVVGEGFAIRAEAIDGTFPDYDRVFPKDLPNRSRHNLAAMGEAIRNARLPKQGRATAVLNGAAVINLPCGGKVDIPHGPKIEGGELYFNPHYLADVAAAFGAEGEAATLAYQDTVTPCLWTAAALPALSVIQMPIKSN